MTMLMKAIHRERQLLVLQLVFFIWLVGLSCFPSSACALDERTLGLISDSVYEVVVLKPPEDSLSYERPLPLQLLPYAERTDKYLPTGTAFSITPKQFISAAHVLTIGVQSQYNNWAIRDRKGNVYPVDKIVKYSNWKDFVVFTVKGMENNSFLKADPDGDSQINQKVFAIGNAHGEGVVIRDGLFTSLTPEEREGKWKWIRFSAAASPGNSGGPLLDQKGNVIGVILRKSPNENLNHALPIREIMNAGEIAEFNGANDYRLDNSDLSLFEYYKREKPLPEEFENLKSEMIELNRLLYYNLMKSLYGKYKNKIFPNDAEPVSVFNQNPNNPSPRLIFRGQDGKWDIFHSDEIKTAELLNNGYLLYSFMKPSELFLYYIRKPDDIPSDKFYNDSKVFMDLILKGIGLPRKVATQSIKITSMGKSQESYSFTDLYGRKWLVKTWLVEYADTKMATISLPVPGGCITLMKIAQSGKVDIIDMNDLKILSNFVYFSYGGTMKQWREFLSMKESLPEAFSSIDLSFNVGKRLHYKSKRLSFSMPDTFINISDDGYFELMFDYWKEKKRTVWDVSEITFMENKGDATGFKIKRNMKPFDNEGEQSKKNWENIYNRRFPFDKTVYYNDKNTNISTTLINGKEEAPAVFYTVEYRKGGKVEQKKMNKALGKLVANLRIYDNGSNADKVIYAVNDPGYQDKGEYHQVLFNDDDLARLNPRHVEGYILRGEIYKDKGDYEKALNDYEKARQLDQEYLQSYFGKDFPALLSGIKGRFTAVQEEIKKVAQNDPNYTTIETIQKTAEDAAAGKIGKEAAARIFRAEAFYSMKLPKEAFVEYGKAVASEPSYSTIYSMRGLIYKLEGNKDQAMADYNKAIEINPQDHVAYNRRGLIYLADREYDKAIEDFSKAITINASYAKAVNNRGNAFREKKQYDRAIEDYNQAIQLRPSVAMHYYNRALALFNKGEYDQAIVDLGKTVSLDERYADAYSLRGSSYMRKGKFDMAVAEYTKTLSMNPYDASARLNRGYCYNELKDSDRALTDYNTVIQIDPKKSEAYNNRGNYFYRIGKIEEALADYGKALELNSTDASIYVNRGLIYMEKKELDHAIADFTEAVKYDPKSDKAYINRGIAYFSKHDYERAMPDFNTTIQINPRADLAYYYRGNIYQSVRKDFKRSIQDYDELIKIRPDVAEGYFVRANSYAAQDNFDFALRDYNQAIAIDPKNARNFNERGILYGRRGHYDDAIADFNRALEIEPQNAELYNNRGYSFMIKKDLTKAVSDFDRAIEINQKHTSAYVNRGDLMAMKKEMQMACDDWEKACRFGVCGSIQEARSKGLCK